MSRRCQCDQVRRAVTGWVYGLFEARIGLAAKAVTVWYDKVEVEWKPNQMENIYGRSEVRIGRLEGRAGHWAETRFD